MELREIYNVRQIPGEQKRRWFTSETMDLILWVDEKGAPTSFQLCYDKHRNEHAITWKPRSGFSHMAIDDGESGGGLSYKAAPMLMANGRVDHGRIIRLFDRAAHELPHDVRDFVRTRIADDH